MNPRVVRGIVALAALVIVGIALRLFIGPSGDGSALAFGVPGAGVVQLRLGAIASAIVAGGALGLSGMLLQALLRNPLAAPFTLGVSAGAGLASTLAAWACMTSGPLAAVAGPLLVGGDGVVPGAIGAIAILGIVAMLGRRDGRLDPLTLILAGTVLATICGALTLLVQSLMPPSSRGDSWLWFMGQVPELPHVTLLVVSAGAVVTIALLSVRLGDDLDAASTSDDEAESLGVPLARLRVVLFTCAGTLAAMAVSLCGPIAFVGFVGPHLGRMLLGGSHRALAVASPLAGAAILVWADSIRQGIDLGAGRLPIGVLTALLGGPVFLVVLRSSRIRSGGWGC